MKKTCTRCKGSEEIKCPTCNGTGIDVNRESSSPVPQCRDCNGSRKIDCPNCEDGLIDDD